MKYAALFACLWFVVQLFRREARENPDSSTALWIPFAWMFLAGTRYVTSWLNLGNPGGFGGSYDEGSPVDRAVFAGLLLAGITVLYRRQLPWGRLLIGNKLLLSYLLYCLVSIVWSDVPFVSLKRWIKDIGNPVMALVILTEPRPAQALGVVLRRLAFIALPVSVLFIRYYPELGRAYHTDGSPMYTGIGQQKNALGNVCLVTGTYFAWQLLQDRPNFRNWTSGRRLETWVLIAMLAWLMTIADSKTSLATLAAVIGVLLMARVGFVASRPERLVSLLVFIALLLVTLEVSVDATAWALSLLDRRPDLTNRTIIWAILLDMAKHPWFGYGFMGFWSDERMGIFASRLGVALVQAHSGYVEQYINLGYVGVAFIVLLLVKGLLRTRSLARTDPDFAHLLLCFVVSSTLYNYTEAAFYGINNMWVLLLCSLIDVPHNGTATPSKKFGDDPQRAVAIRAGAGPGADIASMAGLDRHSGH